MLLLKVLPHVKWSKPYNDKMSKKHICATFIDAAGKSIYHLMIRMIMITKDRNFKNYRNFRQRAK
jgi:primosomal protein N'